MKFLLVPGNNSLSHVAKALAIHEVPTVRGHDVRIAVSRAGALFLRKPGYDHYMLPDIQESDRAGWTTGCFRCSAARWSALFQKKSRSSPCMDWKPSA